MLTFPYTEPGAKTLEGEVVIGYEMAKEYAADRGHEWYVELLLYVIHGCLHLCGSGRHERSRREEDARRRNGNIWRSWGSRTSPETEPSGTGRIEMVPQIQPTDVKHLLDSGEGVILLDVRQPEENAFCALPGSVLIPLGELQSRVGELAPDGRPRGGVLPPRHPQYLGRGDPRPGRLPERRLDDGRHRPLVRSRGPWCAAILAHTASVPFSRALASCSAAFAVSIARLNRRAIGWNTTTTTIIAPASIAK